MRRRGCHHFIHGPNTARKRSEVRIAFGGAARSYSQAGLESGSVACRRRYLRRLDFSGSNCAGDRNSALWYSCYRSNCLSRGSSHFVRDFLRGQLYSRAPGSQGNARCGLARRMNQTNIVAHTGRPPPAVAGAAISAQRNRWGPGRRNPRGSRRCRSWPRIPRRPFSIRGR